MTVGRLPGMTQDDYAMSAEEVALELGTTPGTVYDIQAKAMRKVRAEMARRGLTFQDLIIAQRHDIAHGGHDA